MLKGTKRKVVAQEEVEATKQKEDKEFAKAIQQTVEVGAFLIHATEKTKPFPFLVDMHERLHMECKPLSDKQFEAVKKCMEREEQWKKEKEEGKNATEEFRKITLKLRPFLMKAMELDSRLITGNLKAETAKAWLVEGHADMVVGMSWCVRCGKELKEPASQVTGMGRICAEKMDIPYDPKNVLSMSKKERKAIQKTFIEKLHNQKFERWIPKSGAEPYENE